MIDTRDDATTVPAEILSGDYVRFETGELVPPEQMGSSVSRYSRLTNTISVTTSALEVPERFSVNYNIRDEKRKTTIAEINRKLNKAS